MKGEKGEMKYSVEEIEKCISTLKNLAKDTEQLANLPEGQRIELLKVTGEISRPDRAERKKRIFSPVRSRKWCICGILLNKKGGEEEKQKNVLW